MIKVVFIVINCIICTLVTTCSSFTNPLSFCYRFSALVKAECLEKKKDTLNLIHDCPISAFSLSLIFLLPLLPPNQSFRKMSTKTF